MPGERRERLVAARGRQPLGARELGSLVRRGLAVPPLLTVLDLEARHQVTRTSCRLATLPFTSSIAYQVPLGSATPEARFESIVAAYGFVTARMNWKLGVRHSIFTVFAFAGGTRKWNRTHSEWEVAGTVFAAEPPFARLIVARSTIPSGGGGTLNLLVAPPTLRT